MRKFAFAVLLAATALLLAVPAMAEENGKITWTGMVRSRFEAVENYFDLQDNQNSGDPDDDAFSFWPYRVVVGMNAEIAENITAEVKLQGFGHFGNESPIKSPPIPPDQTVDAADTSGLSEVNVYTAAIMVNELAGSKFSFAVGRMEKTYGTELFIGNYDFYNGTSYDGLNAWWAGDSFRVDGLYLKAFEGNLDQQGFPVTGTSSDENLWGFTFDYNIADNKWGTAGAYYLSGQVLDFDAKVDTYGVRWAKMPNVENGMFDWNIEAAFQSGDFGDPLFGSPALDLSGSVIEGWFGFSFKHGASHSRVHVGYWASSGDDQSTPNEDEGFITLFGDFHAYNRLGDSDWEDAIWGGPSDIEDISLGYDWQGEKHSLGIAYHMFTWPEADSYGSTEDDLGDEIDFNYNYKMNDNLSFGVLVAQFSPGKYFDTFFTPDSADAVSRYMAQMEVRW